MHSHHSLVLRRSARHDVALRARIAIAAEHALSVRFSAGAVDRQGGVMVDLVDLSTGGCALLTGVFIPRNCLIDIRVLGPGDDNATEIVRVVARVQRVIMTDRRPAYLVGTSFDEVADGQAERLAWLVAQFGEPAGKEARA